MRCPNCGSKAKSFVTNSRQFNYGINRRRQCTACGERFTTIEIVDRVTVDEGIAVSKSIMKMIKNRR